MLERNLAFLPIQKNEQLQRPEQVMNVNKIKFFIRQNNGIWNATFDDGSEGPRFTDAEMESLRAQLGIRH